MRNTPVFADQGAGRSFVDERLEAGFSIATRTPLMTDKQMNRIHQLVAGQRQGYSLDRAFYADSEIFEHDLQRAVFPFWQFVGHVARIPKPGDYFLVNIANESIILTRDRQERIHALANVCRHRGSRVCREPEGHAHRLVCPYHAWTYASDGQLIAAREMGSEFDRSQFGLRAFPVQTIEGLIFINLSQQPESFEQVIEDGTAYLKPHALASAKIAARQVWQVKANWKLVMENFRECYHCPPAHPEYCSVMNHGLDDQSRRDHLATQDAEYIDEWHQKNLQNGRLPGMEARTGSHSHICGRYPIRDGFLTQSEGGTPVAPLMGEFHTYDGGLTTLSIYPLHYTSACCDHATLFRFTPQQPQLTEVELTWLVDHDAVAGRDYEIDRLTWMWRITTEQDKRIVDDNQAGVNSRFYQPGPYAPTEPDVQTFIDWYLKRIG